MNKELGRNDLSRIRLITPVIKIQSLMEKSESVCSLRCRFFSSNKILDFLLLGKKKKKDTQIYPLESKFSPKN